MAIFMRNDRATRHSSRDALRVPPRHLPGKVTSFPKRLASNFAILGLSEVLCRAFSVLVMLSLTRRLHPEGFGRIEFAFNIVFWLVLIVRDCFETIITREIARHPRLTRVLVNHVLAVKLSLAVLIFIGLIVVSQLAYANEMERQILILYGLLLWTTALGLDFVFRGNESMGLVALSLVVRTSIYCAGVWFWVQDASNILRVPVFLAVGEFTGIALVWVVYVRTYGLPQPVLGRRFLRVLLVRGRAVGFIQLCQAIIVSADLIVVGVMSRWSDAGFYGAPHRMIAAIMAFGMIFQQVLFPALSRSWRGPSDDGVRLLDFAVRILVTGFLPIAVGGALLAGPLVRLLLPPEYQHETAVLLAIGIWRAPLLILAFLYQSSLVAMDREREGVRLLVCGALVSAPMIGLFRWAFGLPGASLAVVLIGLGLVVAGYSCLVRERRGPAAHHHLLRPLFACLVMIPVSLLAARWHVVAGVLAGALAYLLILKVVGGLDLRPPQISEEFRVGIPGEPDRRYGSIELVQFEEIC